MRKDYKALIYSSIGLVISTDCLYLGVEPSPLFWFFFLVSVGVLSVSIYFIRRKKPIKVVPVQIKKQKKKIIVREIQIEEKEKLQVSIPEDKAVVQNVECTSITFGIKLSILTDDIIYPFKTLTNSLEEIIVYHSGDEVQWTLVEVQETAHNQILATMKVEGEPDILKGTKDWFIASIENEWEGREAISIQEVC
ncbi:hypothetical protein P9597_09335 [Aneurinibacillus migulanus]|uniref:hypothetical protein n=1 Tax=Aneurinibacillus migulanus TaxID=47500 RepID=UPI002E21D273|nr:hypothetical protein [Aneurinibacillus migulanus]